ncbi:MAG: Crp/Fnr family transcriptional regulator [Bacteroidia bacterium]|nr:Crp/Fnr family transcriptional regulator [Bacteroidia bacterium]
MLIPSCVDCTFKKHFFSLMTTEELDALNSNRLEVKYKKGDLICKQGTTPTHIICLYNGIAKVYIEGNNNFLLSILTSQNYIGIQSSFNCASGKEPLFHYSVAALDDSYACLLDIQTFRTIVHINHAVCLEVLAYICSIESDFLKKVEVLSQKNPHGRIADTLLYLSELFNTDRIDMKLTRKDIAELSYTSLENTIKILSELKSDKIINLDGRKLELLDKKKLQKIRELA